MAQSSVISPVKTTIWKQQIFTIHDMRSKSFTIQVKQKDNNMLSKTTVVAFTKQSLATDVAKMIETHRRITKEWPNTTLEDIENTLSMYGDFDNAPELSELHINEWELNDLRNDCVNNLMDMMLVNDIKRKSVSKYIISANLYRMESDSNFYIELFNTLYKK
jgi:hypothetical protein